MPRLQAGPSKGTAYVPPDLDGDTGEAGAAVVVDPSGRDYVLRSPNRSLAFAVGADAGGSVTGRNRVALYTWEQFEAGGNPEPYALLEIDTSIAGIAWGPDGSLYIGSQLPFPTALYRVLPENLVSGSPPAAQIVIDNYDHFLGGMAWDIYGRLLMSLGPVGPNGVLCLQAGAGGGWPSAVARQVYKFFDTGQPDGCLGGFQYAIDLEGRLWSTRYNSAANQDLTRWRIPPVSSTVVTFAASAVVLNEFLSWGGSGTAAGGFGTTNATSDLTAWCAPCAGQLQLGVAEKISAAVAADRVFRIRVNGAPTGMDVTIVAGQRLGQNGRDVLTVAQGDRVTVSCATSEANAFMVHVQFTPTGALTGTDPVVGPDIQIGGGNWTGIAGVSVDENGDVIASNYDTGLLQIVTNASLVPSTLVQNLVPNRTVGYSGFTPEWSGFLYDRSLAVVSFDENRLVQFTAAQLAAGGTQEPVNSISLEASGIVTPGMVVVAPWRGPLR